MAENKRVCVYAICKNEAVRIERWFNCVKDADIVFVLDTGSTDDTLSFIELLNINNSNFYYDIVDTNAMKFFDYGRYRDYAMTKAMNIIRNDFTITDTSWIMVNLDMDEFLEESGIQKIKDNWSNDYDELSLVGVTVGEGQQIVNHKVHSLDPHWEWKSSIHEYLARTDKKLLEIIVDSSENIYYIHEQDKSKKRDYYYEHLLHSYEQDPNNIRTLIYLSWESYNHEMYDDYFKYAKECIEQILINTNDDFYMDYEYLIQCYINCANYHTMLGNHAVANMYLNKALKVIDDGNFSEIRRLYVLKAQTLWELNLKQESASFYERCLKVTSMPTCWVEDSSLYDDSYIHHMLCVAYWGLKQIKNALVHAEVAHYMNKENEQYTNDVEFLREYLANNGDDSEKVQANKICVYAMCKNEIQFVDKWLDSMSEADYIVVLDTGSTDGTYEKLKNDPRVYKVERKIFDPWRFDNARNASMALAPEDANILISTDLDEILDPGWANILREKWINGVHTRANYRYAWSHNENGEPGRIFMYNKIHDRTWYWRAPVHELLTQDRLGDGEVYDTEHTLNLYSDNVFLHHYPDKTKPRTSYLPLLELRAKEDPEDYYGLYYLSHEYFYRDMYDKSIETLNYILSNFSDKYSQTEVAALYLFLGDNYRAKHELVEAINQYNKAIAVDKTYREPYLNAAEVENELDNYYMAVAYVKEAFSKSVRHYTWVEGDTSWREQSYDALAVAYYYLGEKDAALTNINRALDFNPNDSRLLYNKQFIINMM